MCYFFMARVRPHTFSTPSCEDHPDDLIQHYFLILNVLLKQEYSMGSALQLLFYPTE